MLPSADLDLGMRDPEPAYDRIDQMLAYDEDHAAAGAPERREDTRAQSAALELEWADFIDHQRCAAGVAGRFDKAGVRPLERRLPEPKATNRDYSILGERVLHSHCLAVSEIEENAAIRPVGGQHARNILMPLNPPREPRGLARPYRTLDDRDIGHGPA